MKKITTFILIISFSILVLIGCNQTTKQSEVNKSSDATIDDILIVTNPKDDLIGDFAIKEGGRAEIKITKENGNYFVSIQQVGKWTKPEQLIDVKDKDFELLFGENWKSYVKAGIHKDAFGIFKVEKDYQFKNHIFKTGYFVMLLGGSDIYKL